MIRAKCDHRTGILGAAASAAIFAILAATTAAAQSGATVTGVHANEEFCKTMIRQVAVLGQSAKADIFDMTQRAKNFADLKALNATLVKTAPASLASDVALQVKNSNASLDAQLARDPARIKASLVPLRSSEHLAVAKRMTEYCGVK